MVLRMCVGTGCNVFEIWFFESVWGQVVMCLRYGSLHVYGEYVVMFYRYGSLNVCLRRFLF